MDLGECLKKLSTLREGSIGWLSFTTVLQDRVRTGEPVLRSENPEFSVSILWILGVRFRPSLCSDASSCQPLFISKQP